MHGFRRNMVNHFASHSTALRQPWHLGENVCAGPHTKEAWGSAGDEFFEELSGLLRDSTALKQYFAAEVCPPAPTLCTCHEIFFCILCMQTPRKKYVDPKNSTLKI